MALGEFQTYLVHTVLTAKPDFSADTDQAVKDLQQQYAEIFDGSTAPDPTTYGARVLKLLQTYGFSPAFLNNLVDLKAIARTLPLLSAYRDKAFFATAYTGAGCLRNLSLMVANAIVEELRS